MNREKIDNNTFFRTIVVGLLAIGFYYASQYVQLPAFLFLKENQGDPLTLAQTSISIGLYLLLIVTALALAIYLKFVNIKEKLSFKMLALTLSVGEIATYMVGFIGALISFALGDELISSNQQAINELVSLLPIALLFTMTVIGAPVIEEVIFRGLIPAIFSEKWRWIGYVIGAILFGLAHHPNTAGAAIQYIGMGAVFSLVAYFGKRLEYSIFLHMLHNGIAFFVMMSQR